MKNAKRLLAIVILAIMAMTAVALPTAADSIFDTAKPLASGVKATTILSEPGRRVDYKVDVKSKGTLKLNIIAKMPYCEIEIFDSNGNSLMITDESEKSGGVSEGGKGDSYVELSWNKTIEKSNAIISYNVSKGTYYIRIKRNSDCVGYGYGGDGDLTVTADYPSTTVKKAKISCLTLEVPKGTSIKLGTVLNPANSSDKVTWTSSKPSVATVSSTGKVTAKAKGSATITAKCGKSKAKIKIKVV